VRLSQATDAAGAIRRAVQRLLAIHGGAATVVASLIACFPLTASPASGTVGADLATGCPSLSTAAFSKNENIDIYAALAGFLCMTAEAIEIQAARPSESARRSGTVMCIGQRPPREAAI
jgi:hypothetical protein